MTWLYRPLIVDIYGRLCICIDCLPILRKSMCRCWLSQDTGLETIAKDGEGYTSRDSTAVKVSGTRSFHLSFVLSFLLASFLPLFGGESKSSRLKHIPIWIVHLHYSSIHFRRYFCFTVKAKSAWMFGRYICYFLWSVVHSHCEDPVFKYDCWQITLFANNTQFKAILVSYSIPSISNWLHTKTWSMVPAQGHWTSY